MKAELNKFVASAVALTVAGLASSALATPTTYTTVNTLDPNNGTAITVSNSSLATANGGVFVPLAAFQTLITTTSAAGTGGVINFETAQEAAGGAAANTAFGNGLADAATGQINGSTSFKFYRSDNNNAGNGQALDFNVDNGTLLASGGAGGGYLGIQGAASYTLTFYTPASGTTAAFGTPLSSFGLTSVYRNNGGTPAGTFTVNYLNAVTGAGAGSDTSSTIAPTAATGATLSNGVFFGITAPVGDVIGSVTFTSTGANNSRFDDLAAVVATPEPASLALLGLGGIGVLSRRRRA